MGVYKREATYWNKCGIFLGIAATHGGTVNSLAAPLAVRSPEFQAIVQASQELQRVDLDLLHSNTSKICFFTNVLNLLLAHATLSQFCGSSADSRDQERGIFSWFVLAFCLAVPLEFSPSHIP